MTSPRKTWTVVLFLEDQTVEAVPSRWINGDSCLWPAVPRDKLLHLLRNCEYNSCWPSLPVRIFRNATYDDFCVARAKATKAEETSELNTDNDECETQKVVNSKRKVKRVIFSSSEESDNEINRKKKPRLQFKKQMPCAPVWQGKHMDLQVEYQAEDNSENILRPEQVSNRKITSENDFDTDVVPDLPNRELHCRCNPQTIYNIQQMLIELNAKVDNLLKKNPSEPIEVSATSASVIIRSNIKYPIESEEGLAQLEAFLSVNENYMAFVIYFAHQGGSNLYEFIKRCLAPLIADALASSYSFTGKKGKNTFGNLMVSKAIMDSAERNGVSENKKQCELKIGDWLRRAPERKKRADAKITYI